MEATQENPVQVPRPKFPPEYFANCEDVEERRRKRIEALSKPRTPEQQELMDRIYRDYGINS